MDPQTNVARLAGALEPFQGSDLVVVFRDESATERIRRALEKVAAPDLVTLMIGADRGLTGKFHGVDGFIEGWADYCQTFKQLRTEITEVAEAQSDVVYVETRQIGVTATAGVELEYQAAAVFRFADGALQQAEFHLDRNAARRVAGLEPDHPSGG
ncbi:MAG TPA: nuclear transport factor 2 family protein [Solirubrobacterales bacterium]